MNPDDGLMARINAWPRHHALGGGDPTGGLEQNARELFMLCGLVRKKGVKTYVEVGIAAGMLLRFMREEMGLEVSGITLEARTTHEGLAVIYGSSRDPAVIDAAPAADLYFVDADHSYESVREDYMNYRGKCKFMAFHDILGLRSCEGAAAFWGEVKHQHEHWEFCDDDVGIASGIGVIRI